MKKLRRLGVLLLPLPLLLGGCQIFGAAAGLINYLIPIAVAVGGAALGIWLSRL